MAKGESESLKQGLSQQRKAEGSDDRRLQKVSVTETFIGCDNADKRCEVNGARLTSEIYEQKQGSSFAAEKGVCSYLSKLTVVSLFGCDNCDKRRRRIERDWRVRSVGVSVRMFRSR